MKSFRKVNILTLLVFSALLQNCKETKKAEPEIQNPKQEYYTVNDFDAVEKFDSHVHLNTNDTNYIKQSEQDNFRFLDIVDDRPFGIPMEEQQKIALQQLRAFPHTVSYATTFSTKSWDSEDWQEQTLSYLKNSISNGAIAVKIWKNIGMGLRDKNKKFIMVDDPRLDTILDYLADNHITVVGHLGEPKNAWLPLDDMTISGDRSYFSQHPEYHMYVHPEFPSYEEQIGARDRMLEKHPDLQFVGAHLASLEWNLDEVAARLDKYPNLAVDLARMAHLHLHAKTDWQKTHDFFIKYQDRLLYASDMQVGNTKEPSEMRKQLHKSRINNWKFFVTNEKMTDSNIDGEFNGLQLPREVIDKIYRKNAEKWLPGIAKAK